MKQTLDILQSKIMSGDLGILNDVQTSTMLSNLSMQLINQVSHSEDDLYIMDKIIRISNMLYNNTSSERLPLDDGLYDQLLTVYKKYNPNYQVGSTPTIYNEVTNNDNTIEKKIMCTSITKKDKEDNIYVEDIWNQFAPLSTHNKPRMVIDVRPPITKRLINTTHKYPQLVGTLDKCKFVLNYDAREKGVFDKPSVDVFERDFIQAHLNKRIILPIETFEMVGELKYDGVSVEAEVCGDTIISALSRGDTGENIATDLTPIFGGYKFPNAKRVPNNETFGIKFEAVITNYHLEALSNIRHKTYKNCRNAIIGLLGSSDAYVLRDYITLIPLATSLEMNRITEIEFLNKYYASGHYNRYCVFRGNYTEILFHVKQFTEAAEIVRKALPFMIDGVVISYTDPDKIAALGRENSVNKYSMAIKFNPKKVRTNFLSYTFKVGKSGVITPMVNFKPCEFIGTIHNKQTIHSYERFKELNLSYGDEIDIEYVNEVLTYITKPDTEFNRNNPNPPVPFITHCPSCGQQLLISDSGKSIKCININCHEKQLMRMVDVADRLGIRDFSEESIRLINVTSILQLLNLDVYALSPLGPNTSRYIADQIISIKNTPIEDYKLMNAIGIDNIGTETWKSILKHYTISEIKTLQHEELLSNLVQINGIGKKTAECIAEYLTTNIDDINIILSIFHIINTKGQKEKPIVVVTGFRGEFIDVLNANGFDASDKYGVTKNTIALITNDINSRSSKMLKAEKYGIPIYTREQFISKYNINLN